ncbi:MAG: ABC transporter permease [Burkholderiaceae bacterium]|nr:ABC transporter permease [Burkholderiaceae bacterium]
MQRMVKSIIKHRELIWQLTKRDVVGRYKGSWLGLLWAVVTPFGMIALYGFVFGVVMGVRWQRGDTATGTEFVGPMFAGMIVFLFVSECISRAPGVVVGHAELVKKVAFPTEALCSAIVAAALVQAMISLVLLWLWLLVSGRGASWQFFAFVFPWIPLILFALGTTFFLAALGVFVRDISQVTGLLNSALLLLSPVMYPLSAVPESFRPIVQANPLTPFVETVRSLTVFGQAPELAPSIFIIVIGVTAFVLGSYAFARSQHAFVDVL